MQSLNGLVTYRVMLVALSLMFDDKIIDIKGWQPTLVFLPGEFHGQRSLVGYSPWDRQNLEVTNTFTLSLGSQSQHLLRTWSMSEVKRASSFYVTTCF